MYNFLPRKNRKGLSIDKKTEKCGIYKIFG